MRTAHNENVKTENVSGMKNFEDDQKKGVSKKAAKRKPHNFDDETREQRERQVSQTLEKWFNEMQGQHPRLSSFEFDAAEIKISFTNSKKELELKGTLTIDGEIFGLD